MEDNRNKHKPKEAKPITQKIIIEMECITNEQILVLPTVREWSEGVWPSRGRVPTKQRNKSEITHGCMWMYVVSM